MVGSKRKIDSRPHTTQKPVSSFCTYVIPASEVASCDRRLIDAILILHMGTDPLRRNTFLTLEERYIFTHQNQTSIAATRLRFMEKRPLGGSWETSSRNLESTLSCRARKTPGQNTTDVFSPIQAQKKAQRAHGSASKYTRRRSSSGIKIFF